MYAVHSELNRKTGFIQCFILLKNQSCESPRTQHSHLLLFFCGPFFSYIGRYHSNNFFETIQILFKFSFSQQPDQTVKRQFRKGMPKQSYGAYPLPITVFSSPPPQYPGYLEEPEYARPSASTSSPNDECSSQYPVSKSWPPPKYPEASGERLEEHAVTVYVTEDAVNPLVVDAAPDPDAVNCMQMAAGYNIVR